MARFFLKSAGTMTTFAKKPGGKDYQTATCSCGNEAKFVLPYQPIDAAGKIDAEAMLKRGAGLVQVCAVCDDVGRWPNFENVMEPEEA